MNGSSSQLQECLLLKGMEWGEGSWKPEFPGFPLPTSPIPSPQQSVWAFLECVVVESALDLDLGSDPDSATYYWSFSEPQLLNLQNEDVGLPCCLQC